MIDREFIFQGLNAKTELRLAMMLIIPVIIIMIGTVYVSQLLFPKTFFLRPLLSASLLSIAGASLFLKWMITRIKTQNKEWKINIEARGSVQIAYREDVYHFNLSDIVMIKNMGNTGLRYLTIKTVNNRIKIRVGNSGFAPFSTDKDIEMLDALVSYMRPYIDENFNKKELKNVLHPNIIPNFGVFVRKGREIKYNLVNRMTPFQVIILILSLGATLLILFFLIMEYYFR